MLRRFSAAAIGFVVVVVTTGALTGLGMTMGPYAVVLGIMLSLVGVMVLLAATNRLSHMPQVTGPNRARALRASPSESSQSR